MRWDPKRDGQATGPWARRRAYASGIRFVLLASAIALNAACDSGSSPATQSDEPTTTTSTSATTSKWSPDEQAALDAYQAYLDIVDRALTAPLDPAVPALDQYATPEAAQDIRLRVSGFEQLGRAVRPQTRFDAETITIDGDDATIVGCLTDAGVVYEVATGAVINDDSVRHVATTTLTRPDDAHWLVTGTDAGRPGVPCEA